MWPNPWSSTANISGLPFDHLYLGVKLLREKAAFEGFRYKLDPKTGYLLALQTLYSNFSSPIMMLEGETDKDMKTVRL